MYATAYPNTHIMKKWEIILPYFISWIVMEGISAFFYFFAERDPLVMPIGMNIIFIPFYICLFFDLHSRCPICGKRHLRRVVRCSGTRYTLYDAYCPVHDKWIGVERDRNELKTVYYHNDGRWDKLIVPVWKKNK